MFQFLRTYQLDIMLALSSACFMFAIMLFITRFLGKRRRRTLILMEFVATFLLYFDRMSYMYSGDTSPRGYIMVRVGNFMVFFLTSGIVLAFNLYLEELLLDDCKLQKLPLRHTFVSIAALIGMSFVIINLFTGTIYYFDENNVYHRGSGFLICYIIPILGPLIQYTYIRENKKHFTKLIYSSLVLYIFVPVVMGIIQIFTYGISIVNMAMVMVSISLYIFTYLDINAAVIKAHNYEIKELQEEKKGMKRLFEQTATAFVDAVERRDFFAEGHGLKTAAIARRIAEMAGMSEEECEEVYYAALLHDVGTIGLSDEDLNRLENPGEGDAALLTSLPVASAAILSKIKEYPYLKEAALCSHEMYDGSGYPKGLKGKEIPLVARIIAVADAYDDLMTPKSYRGAMPYPTAREELVKQSGIKYDPEICEMMIQIMDHDNTDNKGTEENKIESEISCDNYREKITKGITLGRNVTKICFAMKPLDRKTREFSDVALVLFDSFDGSVHTDPRALKAYHYLEYGELWFDGHFISTGARAMVGGLSDKHAQVITDSSFMVSAVKFEDHVKIEMNSQKGYAEYTIALPDSSKAAFIGITGEHCTIKDIEVIKTDIEVKEGDIEKIAEKESYIDRLESDLPNVQVDRFCSAATEGVPVEDGLMLKFHTMTLPEASLVWHCPFVMLFYSDNKYLEGPGYREFAMIKINGETTAKDTTVENNFSMKKTEAFPGWDAWKEIHKEGLECAVLFTRKGNKITMKTENLGISIENTTILNDGTSKVYVSLTGDQVALTDIRIEHR